MWMNGSELAREAELPKSVLSRWTQAGLVQPDNTTPGSGVPSVYPELEVRICKVLACLRSMGLKRESLLEVGDNLRDPYLYLWWTNKWLIIDDTLHVVASSNDELTFKDLGRFQGPWWVLDLKKVM